jgi:hypothetical protein
MVHDTESVPECKKDRRARSLTDADISEIVKQVNASKHLDCRFDNIASEDLEEAVTFYKNFNKLMTESGNTIWKTLLVFGVGGVCSLILLGIFSKIKSSLNGYP